MVDIRVSILVIVYITIITSNGIVTATSQCVYTDTFNGTKVTIDLSTIVKFPSVDSNSIIIIIIITS